MMKRAARWWMQLLSMSMIFAVFIENVSCSTSEDDVIVLQDSNFTDFIKNYKYVLVEFYAPWCGHCQALEPEYKDAAKKAKTIKEYNVLLAKMDATDPACKETAKAQDIAGFPTLKFFTDGNIDQPIDFGGKKVSSSILSFIDSQILGKVREIKTKEELDTLVSFIGTSDDNHRPIVIGVFNDDDAVEDGQLLRNVIQSMADDSQEDTRYLVSSPTSQLTKLLLAQFPSAKVPFITVYRYHNSTPAVLSNAADMDTSKKIESFISSSIESPSLAITIKEKDFEQTVLKDHSKVFLIEFYAPWCGYCKEFRPKYEEIAKKFIESPELGIAVAKLDASSASEEFSTRYNILGFPTLRLAKNGVLSHAYEKEREVDAVVAWAIEKSKTCLISVSSGDAIESLFGETDEELEARKKVAEEDEYAEEVKDTRPTSVVLITKSLSDDKQIGKIFEEIAFTGPGIIKFAKIVAPITNVPKEEGIYTYRAKYGRFKGNKNPTKFVGDIKNVSDVVKFAIRSSLPNAIRYEDKLMKYMMGSGVPVAVFVFIPVKYANPNQVIAEIEKVGNDHRNDALFAYSDNHLGALMKYFHIPKSFKEPIIKVLTISSYDVMKRYNPKSFPQTVTAEYLEQVVADFKNGELQLSTPVHETEEEEEEQNEPEQQQEEEEEEKDEL